MNRQQRRAAGMNGPLQFPPGAFPNPAQMQAVPQGPSQLVVNGGPLMNDVQLVAFIAASCPGPAAEAVKRAQDIVAYAITRQNEFIKRIEELKKPEEPAKPVLEAPPE